MGSVIATWTGRETNPHQGPLQPEDDNQAAQRPAIAMATAHRRVATVFALAEVATGEVDGQPQAPCSHQHGQQQAPVGAAVGQREADPGDDDEAAAPEDVGDQPQAVEAVVGYHHDVGVGRAVEQRVDAGRSR